jgi:hypothetical protein
MIQADKLQQLLVVAASNGSLHFIIKKVSVCAVLAGFLA